MENVKPLRYCDHNYINIANYNFLNGSMCICTDSIENMDSNKDLI